MTDIRPDLDAGGLDDPAPSRRRRRADKQLIIVSLVVAVGLVLVARGIAVGITGEDRANLPDQVTEVDPVPEAVQVLSQTRVFVDLETGYTGVLVIDDTEIPTIDIACRLPPPCPSAQTGSGGVVAQPGAQVELPPETIYESGNATLTFTPSDAALLTEFSSGVHRAQVIFWKIDEGRQRPRSYSWTFTVV